MAGGVRHDAFLCKDGTLVLIACQDDRITHSIKSPPQSHWRKIAETHASPVNLLAALREEFAQRGSPLRAIAYRFDPRTSSLHYATESAAAPLVATQDNRLFSLPNGCSEWHFTLTPGSLVVTSFSVENPSPLPEKSFAQTLGAQGNRAGRKSVCAIAAANGKKASPTATVFAFRVAEHTASTFRFSATAVPVAAPLARYSFLRYCSNVPKLTGSQRFDLEYAVGEALANAVEHAYPDVPGMVRMQAEYDEHRFTVIVEDDGVWKVPQKRKASQLNNERGRGIEMMQRMMDSFSIHRNGPHTRVLLSLNLSGDTPSSLEDGHRSASR
jgi:anti-sigma regulatory factor (Ser/Thr protein kinase)